MNQPHSILSSTTENSSVSFTTELKHIRVLRLQALGLGLISLGLFYLCYSLEFLNPGEYPAILNLFLHNEPKDGNSLLLALLIAAFGNLFASQFILSEARREAKTVKGLMEAYSENRSKNH